MVEMRNEMFLLQLEIFFNKAPDKRSVIVQETNGGLKPKPKANNNKLDEPEEDDYLVRALLEDEDVTTIVSFKDKKKFKKQLTCLLKKNNSKLKRSKLPNKKIKQRPKAED